METAAGIGFSILVGYLLGSLSPAWTLGRLLKGIDIRTVGYRNAGARNARTVLGFWPALATTVIDLSKGAGAMEISRRLLGLPEAFIAVPVAAAIVGHIFPFYLGFRGGRGVATAVGAFLWLTILEIAAGRFSPVSLGALLLVALILFLATRNGLATAVAAFLFMGILTPLELGITGVSVLTMALAAFLTASNLQRAIQHGVFRNEKGVELRLWRLAARPFALLFIPIDVLWGRTVLLLVVGPLALLFIAIDLFRFVSRRELALVYKSSEGKRLSSMTCFLIAIFIGFLVLPDVIPYLGLAYSSVGGLFSRLVGIRFGRHPLYKSRTWEGTAGFFAGAAMTGYALCLLLPISVPLMLLGAGFAAAVELFSELLDDNFSVSLLTGGFLTALRFFLKI